MNNKNTDLMDLFLNKFPKMKNERLKKGFEIKDLRALLSLNSYNEEFVEVDKENNILVFKNLNTLRKSIAYMTTSKTSGCYCFEFVPVNGSFSPDVRQDNFEAKAFSFCNSHFTCIRINNNGMFIEKFHTRSKITTEFFDNEAINRILGDSDCIYYEDKLVKLLKKLDSSVEDLSDTIDKKYQLSPDLLIEALYYEPYFATISYINFYKNGIMIDNAKDEFPDSIFPYAKYLNFMKEQGFYDDNKNNLIRIRKSPNKY